MSGNENGNGAGVGEENEEEGAERGLENLRNDNRGGAEDAKEGVMLWVISSPGRKTRHASENVASCGGPEPRDGKRGTEPGR